MPNPFHIARQVKSAPRTGLQRELLPVDGDVKLITREQQDTMPFAGMDAFKPDNWKAYMTFNIGHTLPVVAGPLASGNYTGYHPKMQAASYASLLNQQLNLRHMVKAYDPENIARDRIVGCIVGVKFPQGDWSRIPAEKDQAPCIQCVASVFKQAEGVNRMLGQHLASREPWSVSIEVVFEIAQSGLWLASQGDVIPITEAPEDMWDAAVTKDAKTGRFKFGKYKGEQVVVVPGGVGGTVDYQGVGLTPNPAEREAHITEVRAERMELPDGVMALAAEAVPLAMFAKGVRLGRGQRAARVMEVHTAGTAQAGLHRVPATEDDPILKLRTAEGTVLLRSLSSVEVV